MFVTEDYGGERNIIAAQELRSDLALQAAEYLLRSHAHLVLISLRDGVFRAAGTGKSLCGAGSGRWLRTSSSRTLKRRLLLAPDYEGTLATLGAHTRRNLRAYRRRAETALGCSFVPCVELSEIEFVALNGVCAYPTPEFVASWRYRTARSLPGGVFSGLRAQDGRWLSLLGGRRAGDTLSIDWQLNRVEFESLSLSAVMRSYVIEHECREGTRALLFEGGTPHSLERSFTPDRVTDLIAARRSLQGFGLRQWVGRFLPPPHFLARALTSPDLRWETW